MTTSKDINKAIKSATARGLNVYIDNYIGNARNDVVTRRAVKARTVMGKAQFRTPEGAWYTFMQSSEVIRIA